MHTYGFLMISWGLSDPSDRRASDRTGQALAGMAWAHYALLNVVSSLLLSVGME